MHNDTKRLSAAFRLTLLRSFFRIIRQIRVSCYQCHAKVYEQDMKVIVNAV